MTDHTPVQKALERIADVLGSVGVHGRLPYAMAALRAMQDTAAGPDHAEFWRAVYDLIQALDDEQTGQPAGATEGATK